jgi:hypothetical protein
VGICDGFKTNRADAKRLSKAPWDVIGFRNLLVIALDLQLLEAFGHPRFVPR